MTLLFAATVCTVLSIRFPSFLYVVSLYYYPVQFASPAVWLYYYSLYVNAQMYHVADFSTLVRYYIYPIRSSFLLQHIKPLFLVLPFIIDGCAVGSYG